MLPVFGPYRCDPDHDARRFNLADWEPTERGPFHVVHRPTGLVFRLDIDPAHADAALATHEDLVAYLASASLTRALKLDPECVEETGRVAVLAGRLFLDFAGADAQNAADRLPQWSASARKRRRRSECCPLSAPTTRTRR